VERRLEGRVALVTGASRGVGKGIAIGLGEAGATVYVTGRTVDDSGGSLRGTVGETAAEVTAAGGTGIAVACDHHDDAQVVAVFDRIDTEQGRIDILVNNVFNSPALAPVLNRPFWETPIESFDEVMAIGMRSHYVGMHLAAPRMVAAGRGLIVNVSSGGAVMYSHSVSYGVGKAAVDRMTADGAIELRDHGVAVVSLWPGLVRTELVMQGAEHGVIDITGSESPLLSGRAVAALASDRDVLARTGRALVVAELAREFGFTDEDGTTPAVRDTDWAGRPLHRAQD
jgi:dehydrogenase/reductase SDR family member 1